MNLIFADVRERQGANQLAWEEAHAELYVPYATSIRTTLEELEEAYNSDIKVTSGWLAQRRRQEEYAEARERALRRWDEYWPKREALDKAYQAKLWAIERDGQTRLDAINWCR